MRLDFSGEIAMGDAHYAYCLEPKSEDQKIKNYQNISISSLL